MDKVVVNYRIKFFAEVGMYNITFHFLLEQRGKQSKDFMWNCKLISKKETLL